MFRADSPLPLSVVVALTCPPILPGDDILMATAPQFGRKKSSFRPDRARFVPRKCPPALLRLSRRRGRQAHGTAIGPNETGRLHAPACRRGRVAAAARLRARRII